MKKKRIVTVISIFDTDGNITPQKILWDDCTTYTIDKVLDSCPCASLKAGGVGTRYTVLINGYTTHIYLEDNKWFVEEK